MTSTPLVEGSDVLTKVAHGSNFGRMSFLPPMTHMSTSRNWTRLTGPLP